MAEKKTIEVIVAEKGRKDGNGGKDASAPSGGGEVGGRIARNRVVQCPHCGSIRQITEETTQYQWYTCGNCGQDYYF